MFPVSAFTQTEEKYDSLTITAPESRIRKCPKATDSCAVLFKAPQNARYRILSRSEKSENIGRYGRHYWYQIEAGDSVGWVFGGNTSMATEAVDCQCVDYFKHFFQLTGYTANAADWGSILLMEPLKEDSTRILHLPYTYKKVEEPEIGDIVILGRNYEYGSLNTKKYGHIGFFMGYSGGYLLIKGANHPDPVTYLYPEEYRCNNISSKRYRNGSDISFYRREE
ncbi:MAG: hypothetical protein K1X92_09265 [Bacteroidia bacterium]|nr:hypothetical protein [Bacteroidia bacterium]